MNIWGLLVLCCGLAFLTCTLFGFHHFCFGAVSVTALLRRISLHCVCILLSAVWQATRI